MEPPLNFWNNELLLKTLQKGGIAVMPTDTVYGIVGQALNKGTVERIYQTRNRNPEKPCILLIGDTDELKKFSINLSGPQTEKIKSYWPGPVSIIFDCPEDPFAYLHRVTQTLAFRLPSDDRLRDLLLKTGPLIAPSANTEGGPVSKNIEEAQNYFGDAVDLYIDGGTVEGRASKVVRFDVSGEVTVLRE